MPEVLTTWVWENMLELTGALLGLLYIYFSIRQHILTWPIGLLTSLIYTVVFFRTGFYADMGLQAYYVVISIYGWYYWLRGGNADSANKQQVPIKKTPRKIYVILIIATIIIFILILEVLLNFTDSTIPYMDSMTTALSITATWMLARKYIEHWLLWIFIDLFSAGLYLYKNLWPTFILFAVYTLMAAIGYYKWKKDLIAQGEKNY